MTTGAARLGPLHRNGSAYPSRWEPDSFSFHHLTRAQAQQSSSNKGNAPALPQTDGACLGTEISFPGWAFRESWQECKRTCQAHGGGQPGRDEPSWSEADRGMEPGERGDLGTLATVICVSRQEPSGLICARSGGEGQAVDEAHHGGGGGGGRGGEGRDGRGCCRFGGLGSGRGRSGGRSVSSLVPPEKGEEGEAQGPGGIPSRHPERCWASRVRGTASPQKAERRGRGQGGQDRQAWA